MSQNQLKPISSLLGIAGVRAHFIGLIPGVDVRVPRGEAMARLEPFHRNLLRTAAGDQPLVTAEQVHGSVVVIVDSPKKDPVPGTDGLVTTTRGLTLGIYVADCAPVWIVARDGSAGALLHSGKKGTELGITREGIRILTVETGKPADEFAVVIGPCIRPPCYEVDFSKEIARQARDAGVLQIHDEGVCTACNPEHYYSYRREKGLTGRMLATLTLIP